MKNKIIIAIIFIVFGFVCRFFNYPPNFSPLTAITLFAGFFFWPRWFWAAPLTILLFSDFFLGFYDWRLMASVYLSFIFIGCLGLYLRKNYHWWTVGLAALGGSLLFFVMTNLAFWYFSGFYSHDWAGLYSCFILAIPFFKNTLLGDLFFTVVIFGIYALVPYAEKLKIREHTH